MFSAEAITATLHAIARESEAVHANRQALSVERAIGHSLERTMSRRQLSHSCNLLTSRIVTLQRIVTEFDQESAGAEIGSLAELGLRAQTLIVLLLIDELCNAMTPGASWCQELFVGQLRTMEDVVSFVFSSLARINQLWRRHRAESAAWWTGSTPSVGAVRPLLYRCRIRDAQRAMAMLGDDPDFADFLRAGSSLTASRRVRDACDQLANVLTIRLTREPDPALFLSAAVLDPEEFYDLADSARARSSRRWL
jgi:hypothetical protein